MKIASVKINEKRCIGKIAKTIARKLIGAPGDGQSSGIE